MPYSTPDKPYTDFLSILRRSTELLNEDPTREEIFSVERLEQYATYLSSELTVSEGHNRGKSLLPAIRKGGDQLLEAYLLLSDAIRQKQAVSPAAEWFVDNFHIVEDQLREIKRDLPKNYYDELPKLARGELKGYPRVYAMALAMIAHTDSRLDEDAMKRFFHAFQKTSPLQIGELWAVPITLRIALLEHLRPLADRIVSARIKRARADDIADELLNFAVSPSSTPETLVKMLSSTIGHADQFERALVVQLIQRLRDQDPDVWPAFDWLEKQLQTHGTNTVQVTQLEHFRQAADQKTVGNIITSMRLLSSLDWRVFFESISRIDTVLALDPAEAYSKMDFATRDQYRHSIERIGKRSGAKELQIAEKAVELAQESQRKNPQDLRRLHIGYYLIGDGTREFEKLFSYRSRPRESLKRLVLKFPTFFYLGSIAVLTAMLFIPIILYLESLGEPLSIFYWFIWIALFPASDAAVTFLNYAVTSALLPKLLPKMDMEEKIPDDCQTIVVIPTLLTSAHVVQELIERLEVHYLGNQDSNLFFALLGDFVDADTETTSHDENLLRIANRGIEELNERYCQTGPTRFYLFHRHRKWNPSEEKWIGWERKRGKILEFNRLLRGATDTSYIEQTLDFQLLGGIQYVITLDSDTQLPRGAAHRLVGTIAHPLNQPHYSEKEMRVTEGYGILQPRISVSMMSAVRTRFSKIFSGNTGLDPYTTAVSDVYQDLFAEGSFTGKGLYVVDAFEMAVANRGPENAVLSHDLFEGSYARSALVTDIELFDDYPSDYDSFAKRQHRWVRGDWQIAQWLFPKVPDARGRSVPNNLTLISRWKIFDNLRRTLVAPAVLLWLVLAWTMLPGSALAWSLPIVLLFTFPVYAPLIKGIIFDRPGLSYREHFRSIFLSTVSRVVQIILMVAFLPPQAWTQLDAITRALYRKLISKRGLLEWMTFAQMESKRREVMGWVSSLGTGPVPSLLMVSVIIWVRPEALGVSSVFLFLWLTNPLIKIWLSRRSKPLTKPLQPEEIKQLRNYARHTWQYFETFVRAESNFLAPDNYQENPSPVIADRTSPTNIGLQLLSTISAYDLGYVGFLDLVDRVEKVFVTLGKLEKLNGHFFNWYDTKTLEPLRPQYISTVDSGNLAGHLLALKQTCIELKSSLMRQSSRAGLKDTLHLVITHSMRIEHSAFHLSEASPTHLKDALERALKLTEQQTRWEIITECLKEAADILDAISSAEGSTAIAETRQWLNAALKQTTEFYRDIIEINPVATRERLDKIAEACDAMALGMDFKFLFDEQRKIFVIGYNVADSRLDNSFYDLLASESRITSFFAIAKGDVPQEHWFRLGRKMTSVNGGRALISWTGTMFEYLMPVLVMKRFEDTLLDQTYQTVVARQVEYGKQQNVPWGISEAGYNARDIQLNYQYGPFGVPGLGLKRGLSDDLVISPYSTMLTLHIDPSTAMTNLIRLQKMGALSKYGFFEAIDYTADRLPEGQRSVVLKSFMAHHQGMSLVSINNALNHNVMQERFHAEPIVQATQLLLQERVPQRVTISKPRAEEVHSSSDSQFSTMSKPRSYTDANHQTPRTQLLSNGTYTVMITAAGSGFSRCGPLALNRWREDVTRDNWGHFFYIRNRATGKYWSATYQPTGVQPKKYDVTFTENKVEFKRLDDGVITHTEVIVSPEDNVELRRITITNRNSETVELDVTSFLETVLAKAQDDNAHPAFSNLFVQTEFLTRENALLATRRRRSEHESQVWGFHVMSVDGEVVAPVQYETSRALFIGRGRAPQNPLIVTEGRPLSNTVGSVLDPIFSLRHAVKVDPNKSVILVFATGIAGSRDEATRLVDKYHDVHIFERESEIAWIQSQVQLRHLNVTADIAHGFQRLAGRVIYSDPSLRPRSHMLALNNKPQSSLWAYGISGDLPIILTRISNEKDMAMVRELLHAHEYLRLKGLVIDLVIINEHAPSYMQTLQEELQRQIRMSASQGLLDKPGGIFIRRMDIIPESDLNLLKAVARVSLSADKGTLDEQLKRRAIENELTPAFTPTVLKRRAYAAGLETPTLNFFNGLGGFSPNGNHYVIILREGQWTPAPWINVIANENDFGFIISESGSGYTWSVNSRENRLTSWSNDAVSDPASEAIYIRDEETGEFWTPTALPVRGPEPYVITHAQGYSQFEHASHGIASKLQVFVPMKDTIKISRLKLKNTGTEKRKLSVTTFTEWVLGFQRSSSAPSVVTELDRVSSAIFAKNSYNNEFSTRVAFSDISNSQTHAGTRGFTCDRKEFIGRNGSLANPAALSRVGLSGRHGAGLDPCASFQTSIDLAPGEEKEIFIFLGQAENVQEAQNLTMRYRDVKVIDAAFKEVTEFWKKTIGTIEIQTPDAAMNTLVNGWLLYQTLSCRIWARSAFYQSGGAFGFRDQLQDVMALVYSKPEIARAQILRAAGRQFPEGDVQHWWHPPTGRGVRTRFSDDLIWLPFVVSFYLKTTGDQSILSEMVPFIDAPPLQDGQDDAYTQPGTSLEKVSVFEHCARTLDRSLKVGSHGLPLMGSGDWNDGMSRVGNLGRGESVWVAWFLYSTLEQFIPICATQITDASDREKRYADHLIALKKAIEENAWDGDWYLRAFFDDGTPMGSAKSEECRIDSIAQSWSVLSGAGDKARAARAMAAVDEHLVLPGDGLVKLFTPPFDKSHLDPGYIKGYVPGVRENGGQYTHAAIWTMMAYATLGDGDKAGELYALLNPINHAATRAGLHKYKVEPYVVAADIYGLWPHIGRGGWTWYTGSSSWMYRAAIESILGFELKGTNLSLKPAIPKEWNDFKIIYRRPGKNHEETTYEIHVVNNHEGKVTNNTKVSLNGKDLPALVIPLVDDGKKHLVEVRL
jgi:cyclic beta-1,2-glucan synthetase